MRLRLQTSQALQTVCDGIRSGYTSLILLMAYQYHFIDKILFKVLFMKDLSVVLDDIARGHEVSEAWT
jgi:hypothetical protein